MRKENCFKKKKYLCIIGGSFYYHTFCLKIRNSGAVLNLNVKKRLKNSSLRSVNVRKKKWKIMRKLLSSFLGQMSCVKMLKVKDTTLIIILRLSKLSYRWQMKTQVLSLMVWIVLEGTYHWNGFWCDKWAFSCLQMTKICLLRL